MEKAYGLSRAEWAQRVMAKVWSRLLARFNNDMSDEDARDVGDAMELVHMAQVELLKEDEDRQLARSLLATSAQPAKERAESAHG